MTGRRPSVTMTRWRRRARRLVAGGLPDTAGQPTEVQLHMTLDQLRGLPGAADAERSWAAARAAGDGAPGWVYSRAAAAGYACDARLIPVVTGHLDPAVLDAATDRYLAGMPVLAGFRRPDCRCGGCTCPPGAAAPPLSPRTRRRLQDTLLAYAADILSGPAGLAAFLRAGLLSAGFPASVSLPLDTGTPTATIPPHLRRLVIKRDRHCAFPGCQQRPAACQVHHLIPRARAA